jgi:hypothetical protein
MMAKEIKLESIRRAYFERLIGSKGSVDDMMPLFTKAKNIFDVIKKGPKIHRRSKRRK